MGEGFGRTSRRKVGSHNENPHAFQGLWNGVVVDDVDPKKLGRVKVRILDLHDEDTPVSDIPWATACFPTAFCSAQDAHASGGMFHVPPIDALVHVMFQQGDPDFPVWMGGWFPAAPALLGRELYSSNNERKALYNADGKPTCPNWRSLRGHVIELDDDVPEVRITSVNGHKITMSDGAGTHGDCIRIEDHEGNYISLDTGRKILQIRFDGDVEEHITGDKNVKIEGDLIQEVGGDFKLSVDGSTGLFSSGNANIDGAVVNLNCGLAVDTPAHVLQQGDPSAGDYVGEVLARLGNMIRKIVTGS